MAVINIDDAYILNETGAQVDKVTGLFTKDENTTSGEKAFAQLNIGAAGSNRNLLDNPWWGSAEVVNQRGVTQQPSSNNKYTIDRWTWNTGSSANTMSLGANGITFTRSASNIWFAQKMANPTALVGKTITGSVMLSDGTIKSGSVVYASVGSTPTLYQDSAVQIYISSVGAFTLTIKTTQTIRAVKLELGAYSTLANDVPPDYETELDHCKKYFYRIKAETTFGTFGNGFCSGGNAAYVLVPINMRKTPTSGSTSGAFRLMVGAGVTTGVTVTYSSNSNSHMARFDVSQSGSSWTAGGSCILSAHSDTNAYIDISADI